MNLSFYKFEGTGNDFIMLDGRGVNYSFLTKQQIAHLCHRRFGIGADGLIVLEQATGYNFKMVYYNSDGGLSSMCGNGGRCLTAFASLLGIIKDKANFIATDGPHEGVINAAEGKTWDISLKMIDVKGFEQVGDDYFINTGSPHYVRFVNSPADTDVYAGGKEVRYSNRFKAEGTNVNFINSQNGVINVRTYERGVEDETLSCGTGVTASALAAYLHGDRPAGNSYQIVTPGGNLRVSFNEDNGQFTNVWLSGSVKFVYLGSIEV